jgi:hypothetical protein
MRQITYLILCIVSVFCSEFIKNRELTPFVATVQDCDPENNLVKSGDPDTLWIQKVLDNWHYVCLNELNIEVKPLPWIIFYDSSFAWHLNADESILPPFEKTHYSVRFAETNYQLVRLSHTKSIWVPDREPIPLASFLMSTMPYGQNTKVFFIALLPSLFHKFSTPDQAPNLDFLFLGSTIHELTHSRQLPFVLPQLLEITDSSNIQSIDDNTVENEFSQNDRYKQLYFEENIHLWNAVFTVNEDSCLAEIDQAFKLLEIRKREFFTGDQEGLGRADEIFLSIEGSAMWAQYRIMLKNTPVPNERELLSWIVQQTPAWSQERGLVLFLLIDRFSPNWKNQFFERKLPYATEYLRETLANRSK